MTGPSQGNPRTNSLDDLLAKARHAWEAMTPAERSWKKTAGADMCRKLLKSGLSESASGSHL